MLEVDDGESARERFIFRLRYSCALMSYYAKAQRKFMGLRLRQDIVIHASRTKIRYIKCKFSVRHCNSYLHSIFWICRYQGCEKWMLVRALNGIETVNSLLEWLFVVRWICSKILIHYVTNCNHYYLSVVTKLFCAIQWFWWGSGKVSIRTSNKYSYLFWFSPLGCVAEHIYKEKA